ncbi:MAG: Cas10/Cmr2 second palm domain-containing protein [Nocardioides sp.]
MTALPALEKAYLDVGAVRIQSYLGRSRHLWGRSGASALLAAETRPEALQGIDFAGATVSPNPESPTVDGVVSVVLDSPEQISPVAHRLAAHLSAALPGIHLVARAASAVDYIGAHARMAATDPVLEWLPAPFEWPLAARCQECGLDAVTTTLTIVDEQIEACADCAARRAGPTRHPAVVTRTAQATDGTGQRTPGRFTVEHWLLDQTEASATLDFSDLAGLGDDGRGNHLATISADGNALGKLFSEARRIAGDDPNQVRVLGELAHLVTETTKQALLVATQAVYDPSRDDKLPVVPHVRGGDDVLVSVPAERCWPFVRALLRGFGSGTPPADKLAATLAQLGLEPPTLSAGVVICQSSLPFGQQVSLCEELLREAKARVHGHGYSVAWLDTTWDGLRPVDERTALTLDELHARHEGLTQLAGIGKSARQVFAREIDTADLSYARQRMQSRLKRQDPEVSAAVRNYLHSCHPNPLVEWKAPEMVRAMRDGLSLARWWR